MPTFFPPIRIELPRFHPQDSWGVKRVRSFYQAEPTGTTVWILDDNTVTANPRFHEHDRHRIKHEFLGGHYHQVDDIQAAILSSAGYTITTPASTWGLAEWGASPWGQ